MPYDLVPIAGLAFLLGSYLDRDPVDVLFGLSVGRGIDGGKLEMPVPVSLALHHPQQFIDRHSIVEIRDVRSSIANFGLFILKTSPNAI